MLLNAIVWILIKHVIFYNDFIYTSIVMTGWEIVRDVANMFFVLILLFVAIATILSVESYSLKRFLPKIVFMAILINFSKVIAGAIIDFSQIVTWTFASVITQAGIENIYFSFGIQKFYALAELNGSVTPIREWELVAGLVLGLVLLIITFIIILSYTVILVLRIVALWILIILSPLAYLLSAWPGGKLQGYSRQWWDEFSKYVIVAPVLMFFLWLALTASGTDIQLNIPSDAAGPVGGITDIAKPQNFIRFIVTAILLLVGLSAAQKSGVAGASFAGSAMTKMKRVAQGAARKLSGYGYVADRAKAYMDIRKARKRESIISGARSIEKGVAWTQRAAKTAVSAPFKYGGKIPLGRGKTVGTVATAAWDNTVNYYGGRAKKAKKQAEDYKTEAQKHRDDASDLQKKEVPKIALVDRKATDPGYKRLQERREQLNTEIEGIEKNKGLGGIKKMELLGDKRKQLFGVENNLRDIEQQETLDNETINTTNTKAKEDREKEIQEKLQQAEQSDINAGAATKRAEKHTKKQKVINKAIHMGIGGVLAAGAPIPYGIGIAAGAIAGGVGISRVAKNIKEAGKGDGESVKNYEAGQVSEERNKIKDLSNHEVIAKIDDPTLDKYQRAALAMEALSRKLVSGLSDVTSRRDRLGDDFKGNNRILAQMESILEKNYPGATRDFADASIPLEPIKVKFGETSVEYVKEAEKKERAQRNLRDEYSQGDRTLRDTDRATLEKTPDLWAPGIKSTSFVKQYDGLEDEQKKTIIKSSLDEYIKKLDGIIKALPAGHKDLEKHIYDLRQAREKYAGITTIGKAYGKDVAADPLAREQRNKYVASLNIEQVRKILREGDKDKIEALTNAVDRKKDNLSIAVQRAVEAWGGTGKEIAKALKLEGVEKAKGSGESADDEDEGFDEI